VTSLHGVPSRCYVIVSPVKDEERYVERTLQSVTQQTVLPALWVIVDDGSTDRTSVILRHYARVHPWIRVVSRQNTGPRQPGSAVMHAFYYGLSQVSGVAYDYLVKLDCDVDLPTDYFEALFLHFEREPRLGIASGIYLEDGPRGWLPIAMPDYHAAGASKVIRAQCFNEIGGFLRERGWDTVDEVRAQVKGWLTRHFADIRFRHLKPEGSGIGNVRTNVMHGDVYYLTGGGILFLLLKVVHRAAAGSPPVVGGLAMLYGYLRSLVSGRHRLVDADEARHYRRLLNRRLFRLPAKSVQRGDMNAVESR
jgi:biofilm PGA synthesis N-glycosyltransferase PgaC